MIRLGVGQVSAAGGGDTYTPQVLLWAAAPAPSPGSARDQPHSPVCLSGAQPSLPQHTPLSGGMVHRLPVPFSRPSEAHGFSSMAEGTSPSQGGPLFCRAAPRFPPDLALGRGGQLLMTPVVCNQSHLCPFSRALAAMPISAHVLQPLQIKPGLQGLPPEP